MRARTNETREYESPIHSFRVDNGLTLAELCKKTGLSQSTICGFANGMLSPIEAKSFKLKASAQRLCDFFKVSPDALFPRYICSIDRGGDAYAAYIDGYDTLEKRFATDQNDILDKKILLYKLIELSGMSKRQHDMVTKYYMEEYTMKDIAIDYDLSHEGVRQTIIVGLRKLRSGPARLENRRRRQKGRMVNPSRP